MGRTAERLRGKIFEFAPTEISDISRLGGTLTGTTRFDIEKGMYFNGSSYVTVRPSFQPFSSGFWSACIEFTPNFEANEAQNRAFFDTQATARTIFYHHSDGRLILDVGGTGTYYVPLLSYSPYWKVNQRNTLVWCIRSGLQQFYLNGVFIGQATTVLSASSITSLTIGAVYSGTYYFKGSIHSIKFFRHNSSGELLTTQEAADFYTRATYKYQERATCILPFSAATHDSTNARTLDVSPNGRHFTFGDGVTSTTFPTKLATRGYSFDGGDYLRCVSKLSTELLKTTPFTICACAKFTSSAALAEAIFARFDANGAVYDGMFLRKSAATEQPTFGFRDGAGDYYFYAQTQKLDLNAIQFIGVSYNGSLAAISANMTVNGVSKAYTNTILGSPSNPYYNSYPTIGAWDVTGTGMASFMTGSIFYFALYPFALTPLQIKAEYLFAMQNAQKV